MNTKYGAIPDEMVIAYVNGMKGKLFKMLPMKEKNIGSLNKYMNATLREFVSNKEVVDYFKSNQDYLTLINTVNSLISQNDIDLFRSDFFKAMSIIERMLTFIEGDLS